MLGLIASASSPSPPALSPFWSNPPHEQVGHEALHDCVPKPDALERRVHDHIPHDGVVDAVPGGASEGHGLTGRAVLGVGEPEERGGVVESSADACRVSAREADAGEDGVEGVEELIDRGITPFKNESDLSNGYLDTPVDWIPGLKNMRLRDLPSFIRTTDPDDTFLNYIKIEGQKAFEATAIIINTFDELEDEVLSAMATILPPIYTVGPISLLCSQFPVTQSSSIGSSFLKEDESCLEWLDERDRESVVYVNFGSLAVVSNEQLIEFAWGLANSKHNFLWILRPDLVSGEAAVLPEEFLDEIKGRGFLASWCPQERVLSHPSVRGFLTHSGWNSTMESVSAGKPMICWPYFADQPINCRYVCNEWGMGMEIDNEVKREQVEELIAELMDGEKGKEMKKKAVEWKEKTIRATQAGGSSFINFNRVLDEVLLRRR
ncbi:hypothetical protein J5N97_016939 [Dioscorea zingiberensis]|uniref:Glycosyltransferase n=1 Tax=Dioscorea zingiberensis TaxID=325984 RepID=A0A9D5HFV9_9LILI|nr:hypothetical protein J5N97_016939 [Dioscorea zingiberensis]